ncbi:MAG: hypothetical protein R3293_15950 [Candidatus Promineifilaceae bacterium]|nr:hypothetical protein [Candidatus Promineifilaceae bacterium]
MAAQGRSYGQILGRMYKRWVLDCVVDIAYAVSIDFSQRPELYQNIDPATADKMTDLQSAYGYAKNFPSHDIRANLLLPIFGQSYAQGGGNDGSPFQTARMVVLAAAADFAENAQPTGFPMLRERIRSALVPFKNHMEDVKGASLAQTNQRTDAIFTLSSEILRDPQVAGVFGVSSTIDPDWPLAADDTEGAKLIEKITTQLQGIPAGQITSVQFIRKQRYGSKGEISILHILESDFENDDSLLDDLTAQLYAWGSDLGLIGGSPP